MRSPLRLLQRRGSNASAASPDRSSMVASDSEYGSPAGTSAKSLLTQMNGTAGNGSPAPSRPLTSGVIGSGAGAEEPNGGDEQVVRLLWHQDAGFGHRILRHIWTWYTTYTSCLAFNVLSSWEQCLGNAFLLGILGLAVYGTLLLWGQTRAFVTATRAAFSQMSL